VYKPKINFCSPVTNHALLFLGLSFHHKPDIIDIIERKMLQWYGHVKRMQKERLKINYGVDTGGEEGKEDVQEKRGWKVYEQP
jgi:hypothetical protein